MTSGRSLAPVSVREVERVVQAVNNTTHSYTIMPMIYADGRLAPKLFVVLQEAGGVFPKNFANLTDNLIVCCHTSHIMTKGLMETWIDECLLTEDMPDDLLLIVDSWSSFKDHRVMQSHVPDGKRLTICNIPPKATSLIQPLDVFFFRIFKGIKKS